MPLQGSDDPLVPADFGGPATISGVVPELLDVGQLGAEGGSELGGGDEVGTRLAHVRVGTGLGHELPGALAVCDAGLEHLGREPTDSVGNGRAADGRNRNPGGKLARRLLVGGPEGR